MCSWLGRAEGLGLGLSRGQRRGSVKEEVAFRERPKGGVGVQGCVEEVAWRGWGVKSQKSRWSGCGTIGVSLWRLRFGLHMRTAGSAL